MEPTADVPRRSDDAALLEEMRAGSEAAFDAIFRAHYAPLVGAASALLRDRDAAEEVAQDVLVELWRRRADLVIDTTLRAYLFRAVRNRALNRIRHEKVARAAEPLLERAQPPSRGADIETYEREIGAALDRALDELPPRCREVFELSRVHGLRYTEIASALGISIKTVEAQMGKALRLMREHMAAWLPD